MKCGAQGLSAVSAAKTFATVSDIGFGVGIAGMGTGLVLVLAPSSPSPPAAGAWTLR